MLNKMILNSPQYGYMLGNNPAIYAKMRQRQLGGSIFSAIFSSLKSLVGPLLGSFTKKAVIEGAKTVGKEALKSALPEAGKALGKFGLSKLNSVLNKTNPVVQEVAQVLPQVTDIMRRVPKKIDQGMIDSEMRKFRDKLNSLSIDESTGSGMKRGRGRKIMDYM